MTLPRNIGADLVEKRLWPVALALLVALVAIPARARRVGDEPAGDRPSPADRRAPRRQRQTGGHAEHHAGRAPRTRGGSSKNPFKQLYVPKAATPTSAATVPTGAGTGRPARAERRGPSGDSAGTDAARRPPTSTKPKAAAEDRAATVYRATLRFGEPGDAADDHDIPRLTPLPSIDGPVLRLPRRQGGRQDARLPRQLGRHGDRRRQVPARTDDLRDDRDAGRRHRVLRRRPDRRRRQAVPDGRRSRSARPRRPRRRPRRKARARHSKAGAALLTIAREDATAPRCSAATAGTAKRGVLDVVARKARTSKVAVGPIAGTGRPRADRRDRGRAAPSAPRLARRRRETSPAFARSGRCAAAPSNNLSRRWR